MKKSSFLLFAFRLFIGSCAFKTFAQDLPNISPPSPDVAAISTHTDVPVSESTGIPNISIPMMQLNGPDLSLPISIGYHAGGIRVNQFASSVGLGWSLNAGGSISKSNRGRGDCESNGFINPSMTVDQFHNLNATAKENFLRNDHDANFPVDFQSDVYYFNFLNYSGKFYLKQLSNGGIEILQEQKSDIKFIPTISGSCFDSWEAIAPDGTKFYFGKSSDGSRTAINTVENVTSPSLETTNNTESWELMEIVTPNNNVTSFYYNNLEFFDYHNVSSQNYIYEDESGQGVYRYDTFSSYDKYRLTSITNNLGSVTFDYEINRIDIEGSKALTKIKLKDFNNNLIETYQLEYDYFSTTSNGNVVLDAPNESKKRLRLNSITQKKENEENKVYRFEYNNQTIPNRHSFSQDFWGFYNGKTNQHLFPKAYDYNLAGYRETHIGADRSVDTEKAKVGILEKIIYPTGGFTEFTYESNLSPNLPGGTTFGPNAYDQNLIGIYSTQGTAIAVPTNLFTLPVDFDLYEGGYTLSMLFTQACTSATGLECPYARIYLVDNLGNETLHSEIRWNSSNEDQLYFSPSTLQNSSNISSIKVVTYKGVNNNGQDIDMEFTVKGYEIPVGGFKVGGLRIKNMKFYSKDNQLEKEREYRYTLFNDATTSSGIVLNPQILLISNGIQQFNQEHCAYIKKDILKSASAIPTINLGSPILYQEVTILDKDFLNPTKSIKEEKTFLVPDTSNWHDFGIIGCSADECLADVIPRFFYGHKQGLLINDKKYASDNNGIHTLAQESINTYTTEATNSALNIVYKANEYVHSCSAHQGLSVFWFFAWTDYMNHSERHFLTQSKQIDYFDIGSTTYITNYFYDNGYYSITSPIFVANNQSNNKTRVTHYEYAKDMASADPIKTKLLNANRVSEPITVKNYIGDGNQLHTINENNLTLLNTQKTNYQDWGNGIVSPQVIQSLKGEETSNNPFKDRIEFKEYDSYGNILQVSKSEGMDICYIYGYQNSLPVAKIENATNAQVSSYVSNIQNKSNLDDDHCLDSGNCDEKNLRIELNALRNGLPDAMVTTYTYDPLIGVTSITDPRGYTTYYEYDAFNRLIRVKDEGGKILSENQYHYYNQN